MEIEIKNNIKSVENEERNEGFKEIENIEGKEQVSTKSKMENETSVSKSVSFWKIQYGLATGWDIFTTVVGLIISTVFGTVFPMYDYLSGLTINELSTQADSEFISRVTIYCIYFVYLGIVGFFASALSAFIWTYNGKIISRRIREEYFRIIMKQEQAWFDNKNTHEFGSKVQLQTTIIGNGIGLKIGNTISSMSAGIGGIIMSFIVSWKLTLVMFSVYPILVLCSYFLNKLTQESSKNNREAFEKAGGIAEEILYSIKTVASFCNFQFELDRFNTKLKQSLDSGIKRAKLTGIVFGIFNFFMIGSYAIGMAYAYLLVSEKDTNPNTGKIFQGGEALIVFSSLVFGSYTLGECTPSIKAIIEACAAAYDFFELKESTHFMRPQGKRNKPEKSTITGEIKLKNLVFSYPSNPDKIILSNINLDFEAGKSTALIGASGSGKSTIVSLIERLYDPTEGDLLLDNYNIKDLDVHYLRSLIGYVAQEPILFNTSIRDNIIFGREGITDDQILEACDKARVTEFLSKMDDGIDTIVGVKGGKLSGGQKQRIAIARAILTRPKILILDEATSALDNKSEKEVQMALNKVSEGITTIIIAHRLTTIINADKIVALKYGKIMEIGNHQSLLALNGYYASLIKNQLGIQEYEKNNGDPEEILNNDNCEYVKTTETALIVNRKVSTSIRSNSVALEISIQEDLKKKQELHVNTEKNKKKLFPLVMEHKFLFYVAIFSSAINGLGFPLFGTIIGSSIDVLSSTDVEVVKNDGLFLTMMFLILAIFMGLFTFLQNYSFESLGEKLTKKLRELVFTKYLSMPMGFYDIPENTPGALLTKLTSDTASINSIVLSIIGVLTQTMSTVIVSIVISVIYDWKICLINVAFMPLIMFSSVLYVKMQAGNNDTNESIFNYAGNILSESVCNTKTIFSYNMQEKVVKIYSEVLDTAEKDRVISCLRDGVIYGLSQMFMLIMMAPVFYAAGTFIFDKSLTLGNMLRAFYTIWWGSFSLGLAQKYVSDLSQANQSLNNIFNTLDMPSSIDPLEDKPSSYKPDSIQGKIEFRNVSFHYPTRKDQIIYDKINFTIQPGQSAAFVGLSGSGKSTIIQLLERFYDITSGEILIDNVDLRSYDITTLRNCISLVQQEPTLFKRNIGENIKYGKLDATEEEILHAAEEAKISSKISGQNINVSGGEKQRVAIARALIRDPKILLLDEATSALDKTVEEEIQKSLNEIMKGKTSIVIAHRLSTVEKCNIIFVMEGGKIVERGNHDELISMKGKYYDLYNLTNI